MKNVSRVLFSVLFLSAIVGSVSFVAEPVAYASEAKDKCISDCDVEFEYCYSHCDLGGDGKCQFRCQTDLNRCLSGKCSNK